MHAFHEGGIDKNLAPGPGGRQFFQLLGVQLECQGGAGRLPEIGAQDIFNHVAEAAQDAVIIQAGHIAQRRFDSRGNLAGRILAAILGVAARDEQSNQQRRNVRIAVQRLLHIVLAEGNGGLAQEFRHGAQNGDGAPIQSGPHYQAVEIVAFRIAADDGVKSFFQRRAHIIQPHRLAVGAFHQEVQDHGFRIPAVIALEAEGEIVFRHHFQAQILEHRQGSAQRQDFAQHMQLQPDRLGSVAFLAPDAGRNFQGIGTGRKLFQYFQIAHRVMGGKLALIAGREFGIAHRGQAGAFAAAMAGAHRLDKSIIPGLDRLCDLMFQRGDVHARSCSGIAPDDIVHAHQRGFINRHIRGRGAPVQGTRQNGVNAAARGDVDVIARREHQRRGETVEPVKAQEQPHLGPSAQAQYPDGDGKKFIL